jgi:hypothetical protein
MQQEACRRRIPGGQQQTHGKESATRVVPGLGTERHL